MASQNFCPNCNNLLHLTKDSQVGGDTANYSDVIESVLNKEETNYTVNMDNLKQSTEFQELNKKEKKIILDHFAKNSIHKSKQNPIHVCNNCSFKRAIEPGHIFYRKISNLEQYESSAMNYKLIANDPTLPITRNYSCKNVSCLSHSDPSKREAVFITTNKVTYICRSCFTHWDY
jgi:DNA-directed RNA polymerase subunit M/transcription elongation factor TFIIS